MLFRSLIVLVLLPAISIGGFSKLIPVEYPWETDFRDVAELGDGSLAVTVGIVMEDPFLLHFSNNGELLGEYTGFGVAGRGLEGGGWLIPSPDGGLFLVAYSEPRATGVNSDVAVFGLGSDLSVDWCEVIGEGTDSVYTCYGAAPGAGGGCVIVGGSGYGERMFIREYSATGHLLWERSFDEFPEYTPGIAAGTGRGTLAVMSDRWNEVVFFMMDSLGATQWTLEVPYASGPGASAIQELENGYLAYVPSEQGIQGGALIQVDGDGCLLDLCEISHGMQVRDVILHEDDKVVFAGSRICDGEEAAVLEAWDCSGNLLWSRSMDGTGDDGFTSAVRCSDLGFALIGYSSCGGDEFSCVLVKTEADGTVYGGSGEIPLPDSVVEAASLIPGWVIACGVFSSEDMAFQQALYVHEHASLGLPGALWIPDWSSLSGYSGWLGYIHSLPVDGLSEEQLEALREACPDAYMVWVGVEEPAEGMTVEGYFCP